MEVRGCSGGRELLPACVFLKKFRNVCRVLETALGEASPGAQ
jgi:hypothetical protein